MDVVDISSLSKSVLWATFAITFFLGAVMQKTGFCSMGAISDIFIMSSWGRLKQWFLAIGVAIIGFTLMSYAGLIDPLKSFYTSSKFLWLSTIVGSILFGLGMVLASGCGSKTLIRIGGGNLKSIVVFMVLGLTAYMTMRGFLGVVRINTLDTFFVAFNTSQDLPSLLSGPLGIARPQLHLALGLIIGAAFIAYALASKVFWTAENVFAGIAVGLAICAVWWVSGNLGYVAEDPNTLEEVFLVTNSGRMESLSFVAPYAYSLDWLMMYSDTSKVLTVGIVAVLGMILGSAVISIATKSFRWESFRNTEDTANHLVGAALMGFGGVTALGCTVGQGLSGISTLAIGSLLALPGFILGAYLGLRYLQVRLAPNPCS
ncbi:YeeE/YedE family protein [Polynucleobacter sp. MWH-HuK1]|uniref:YeeE/YedE family protein n=1 Tax=Polynucleobacter sp. MWH-HuK1 TaxID=1743158 RepID=UPI001C0B60D2|nr:YeeE/YedE family protein [Polynucleobacter sp. MWH-HuK1]MBU3566073.1 YeeE/YedE family protein [Polynucleobacter sp. MWH-HuK1]